MSHKLRESKQAVAAFAKTANAEDEFFLVRFSGQPELAAPFAGSLNDIQNRLLFTQPAGKTALLDAVCLALDYMRNAKNPRKVLVVISDGGDNHSRYTRDEIRLRVREADLSIYAIGIYEPMPQWLPEEERPGTANPSISTQPAALHSAR
jgi:Ca-activated chloride channel family protein